MIISALQRQRENGNVILQEEDEEEQFSETESPTHLRQLLAAELGEGTVLIHLHKVERQKVE